MNTLATPTTQTARGVAEAPSDPGPARDLGRVAFVTDIVTPYMAAVLAALADRVELRVIFCSATGTRGCDWQFPDGLPFEHRVIDGLALRRRSPDATDYYVDPRILSEITRWRPRTVISAGFSVPTAYAAAYCRAARARLIIYSDGTSHSERHSSGGQLLARRALLPRAAACVGKSRLAEERFVELGMPRARVFRANHSTRLEPLWAVARERFSSGAPATEDVEVLTVGRLIARKGVDRLLRAAARAEAGGQRISVTLAGAGPEEARLRELARGLGVTVRFLGFVDQPHLPEVYRQADIFAFPTLDDPFGIALLEAAATGLPSVASPFGGATDELVRERETGFVVDPDDADVLGARLAELARDPALRRRLGQAAYHESLERTPAAAAFGYEAAISAVTA